MQAPAFVLRRHVVHQTLASRAFILIVFSDVAEGITAKQTFGLVALCLWLGQVGRNVGFLAVP